MAKSNEDRIAANEAAEEVVAAFADLFPKLSLPLLAWDVLKEMISREMLSPSVAAEIAAEGRYQRKATKSGLR